MKSSKKHKRSRVEKETTMADKRGAKGVRYVTKCLIGEWVTMFWILFRMFE